MIDSFWITVTSPWIDVTWLVIDSRNYTRNKISWLLWWSPQSAIQSIYVPRLDIFMSQWYLPSDSLYYHKTSVTSNESHDFFFSKSWETCSLAIEDDYRVQIWWSFFYDYNGPGTTVKDDDDNAKMRRPISGYYHPPDIAATAANCRPPIRRGVQAKSSSKTQHDERRATTRHCACLRLYGSSEVDKREGVWAESLSRV